MKLGLYTFSALMMILFTGVFVYTLELGDYRLDMVNINLPVALWVMIPGFILFLFTLFHIFYYGLRNYLQIKKWKRDIETLEDALYWSLVNEPKAQKYAIHDIESIASLLSKSSLEVNDNIEGLSPRLAKVVNILYKIKNGEYVDLKEEKMLKVFHSGNPILIQNRLNQLESDSKFVENVMKSSNDYSKAVQKEALKIFVLKSTFSEALKYTKIFDVENFLVMLNRVTAENDLGLTKEIVTMFVMDLKLSCVDFIKIAEVTKKYFKPDENILLFKNYQKENEKAQNAYLYLLFEYELIDQAKAYLEEQEENDFIKFRALLALKHKNASYKLDDIIDIYSVCIEKKFI